MLELTHTLANLLAVRLWAITPSTAVIAGTITASKRGIVNQDVRALVSLPTGIAVAARPTHPLLRHPHLLWTAAFTAATSTTLVVWISDQLEPDLTHHPPENPNHPRTDAGPNA